MPLLQCADPELFSIKNGLYRSNNVVFVGNSYGKSCPILDDAISADLKPIVVGKNWPGLIDESLIAGKHIEEPALAEFYTSSSVVLCDNRQDKKGLRFISSQIFNAVMCGAVPICNDMPGINDIFDDLVYLYSSGPDELNLQIQKALSENAYMQQRRLNMAQKIAKDHSFDTRAGVIDSIICHALLAQNNQQ